MTESEPEKPEISLRVELDNRGIHVSVGGPSERERLEASPDASQSAPRGHYVYAHVDRSGNIFYVGKGQGQRAWSKDRHKTWKYYVEHHLAGHYDVRILADGLDERAAEDLEAEWIAQEGARLVNWFNMARITDFEANRRYWKLRKASREMAARAKELERSDLSAAVELYHQALKQIDDYATIESEGGLVGQLLREIAEEEGRSGDIRILDRLSLCLVRSGRAVEAESVVRDYFKKYRKDDRLEAANRIRVRVQRGVERQRSS